MLTDAQILSVANFRQELADEMKTSFGASIDASNSAATAQEIKLTTEVSMSFLLPDAATATYLYTAPDDLEIIEVIVIKDAAGAGNTIQITNGSGVAISDAIAAAVDKTVTRAGTLDVATRVLAADDTFKIVNTRAAGSSAATVIIRALRR